MSKALDSQRTYALIGTGGCGKTSLAEMLLFQSGVINRLGAIEEGTTTLDYEPEEIKRRGSIQPGFATFLWNKDRHFLMDVPGDTNFTGDLPYLLMGVDAAVLVIDAVDGVRPLTRRIWNAVREAGLPSFVFINKMDRDRADFDMAFNGLSSVLGMKPVTLYMPVMTDGVFTGVVDILGGKALMFGENGAVTEALIPDAIADEAALLHDTTVENIAESDEELMEKYLEEGSLSEEDLASGLRKGVLNASLVPVVVGSSLENKGGRELLDAIARLFPSPLERPAFLDADGRPLGKPRDEQEAEATLRALSGRTHEVLTGVTLRSVTDEESFCCATRVTFLPIDPQDIRYYVSRFSPLDKAGAYGVQGKGALLVERIDGDFFNVMGLPVGLLADMLRDFGIELLE